MKKKMKSIWRTPSAFDLFKGANRLVKMEKPRQPSELHARDRYAVADWITESLKSKTAVIAVIVTITLSSCAMQKPGSASLHKAVRIEQETQQYQASISSGKDWTRMYRNQDRRPHKMTRIPFTQLYIF